MYRRLRYFLRAYCQPTMPFGVLGTYAVLTGLGNQDWLRLLLGLSLLGLTFYIWAHRMKPLYKEYHHG